MTVAVAPLALSAAPRIGRPRGCAESSGMLAVSPPISISTCSGACGRCAPKGVDRQFPRAKVRGVRGSPAASGAGFRARWRASWRRRSMTSAAVASSMARCGRPRPESTGAGGLARVMLSEAAVCRKTRARQRSKGLEPRRRHLGIGGRDHISRPWRARQPIRLSVCFLDTRAHGGRVCDVPLAAVAVRLCGGRSRSRAPSPPRAFPARAGDRPIPMSAPGFQSRLRTADHGALHNLRKSTRKGQLGATSDRLLGCVTVRKQNRRCSDT